MLEVESLNSQKFSVAGKDVNAANNGVKIILNNELNGIEVYFSSKPEQSIIENLKTNKFRWSGFKKCWYAKQSEKTFRFVNSLTDNSETVAPVKEEKKINKLNNKKEPFNLWNATRWENINLTQEQKDQDIKLIAKEIRSHVRKRFPMVKFSVTVPYYGKINFSVKSSPYEKESAYLNEILGYCENLLSTYKHCYDPSDPYTDYAGSYNFYGHAEIDWDYKQTEVTEEIKKDMQEFDNKLLEFEAAEEERKHQEFLQWQKESEERELQYKRQQEEEKKVIENIYNSIEVKELDDNSKYFVTGAAFADLNKNNTLDEYKGEVEKGKYSLENVKITKEIHFNNLESLENFSNMLLTDFDFLSNTGGSYTDDNRINSMTDFYNMDEEERKTVQWTLYGVAIYFNNELQFVVDAQGYNYARYVGLTDNAKIKNTITVTQVLSDEEKEELKHQADRLEDISVSVIEELNIQATWENEKWQEYKETMKAKLNDYNFKLTKGIIQQLDVEQLKVSMYKLLQEVDGIQEQFKKADIKQGEKLTLFYISDFGSIVTSRITFDSVTNEQYAQYKSAVKLTFTPENKRKLHYQHFYSTLLVYKGWLKLEDNVLHNVENKGGILITSSKYMSCDNKQYDEILNHFKGKGIKPVINTYKPSF